MVRNWWRMLDYCPVVLVMMKWSSNHPFSGSMLVWGRVYTYLPRHEHDFLVLEPPFFQTRQAHGPPQPQDPKNNRCFPQRCPGPLVRLAVYLPRSRIRNSLLPGDLLALPPETPDLHPDHWRPIGPDSTKVPWQIYVIMFFLLLSLLLYKYGEIYTSTLQIGG